MKKIFLTFGDCNQDIIDARERVVKEARATGQFDEVLGFNWSNASLEAQASPLKHCQRGGGYWIWKPDIIWAVLESLQQGDILVYSDAGNVIHKATVQWRYFFRLLESVDLICKKISSCVLHRTRYELLSCRDIKIKSCRMCYNFEANTLLIKKSKFTCELVQRWREIMIKNPILVRDVDTETDKECQLPTFIEHRHDQSILTMLLYSYLSDSQYNQKIKMFWELHHGFNIWSDPCIEVVRNRTGKRIKRSLKYYFLRGLYRILWGGQQLLEKNGICIYWTKISS